MTDDVRADASSATCLSACPCGRAFLPTCSITLTFSATLLGERFSSSQYVGSLIIVVGTMVALLPTLSGDDGGHSTVLGLLIYGSSNFPASFSTIYKVRHAGSGWCSSSIADG